MELLQELRQPRPDELPATPRHVTIDPERDEPAHELPPAGGPCSPVRGRRGGRSRSPRRTSASHSGTHSSPAAPIVQNTISHARRASARARTYSGVRIAPARAALEQAVAERPVLRGQNLPGGDQRARPVPGLEQPEHRRGTSAASGTSRSRARRPGAPKARGLGSAGERRGDPGERPADQHDRVEPPRAEPVREEPEEDRPGRERPAEAPLDPPVPRVVEVVPLLQFGRRLGAAPAGPCSSAAWRAAARRRPTTSTEIGTGALMRFHAVVMGRVLIVSGTDPTRTTTRSRYAATPAAKCEQRLALLGGRGGRRADVPGFAAVRHHPRAVARRERLAERHLRHLRHVADHQLRGEPQHHRRFPLAGVPHLLLHQSGNRVSDGSPAASQ